MDYETLLQARGRGPDETAAAYAFHYDTRDGRPRIDQPGFVAALQLMQRLQACRPAGGCVGSDSGGAGWKATAYIA